jgi:signal transduction histidine kinase
MSHEEPDIKESLIPVLHQVLVTHEEEKRAAALTLHDEIAQNLTLVSLHLSVMRKQYAVNPELVADAIPKLQEIIAATQGKVRGLEFGLYPKVVELSITEAVKGLLHRLTEARGYAIEYSSPPAIKCGRKSAIGLYRVLESLFTQSGLSARPTWCVTLTDSPAGVILSISTTSALPANNLSSDIDALTREIMSAHGGMLSLTSPPDRIEIVFPKE